MKKVKVIFPRDIFHSSQEVPDYQGGVEYEFPENAVDYWIKRGAQIVAELRQKAAAKVEYAPKVEEPAVVPVEEPIEEEVPAPIFKDKTPKFSAQKTSKK